MDRVSCRILFKCLKLVLDVVNVGNLGMIEGFSNS